MTPVSRPLRAKLIYNAQAGPPEESSRQRAEIVDSLRSLQIEPDVFDVRPGRRIDAAVRRAIRAGTTLIVVAGGDGTIDHAMQGMVGTSATLGIIPIGTRNNIALSLNIPKPIPEAAALLRLGRPRRVDVGRVRRGRASRWFMETVSLGLISMLYPAADDIQHGNPTRVAELLSTFVTSTPSRLHMTVDRQNKFDAMAHTALLVNMPFVGPNFRIAPDVAYDDGLLDLFVFHNMDKIDLLAYATKWIAGPPEDDNVQRFKFGRMSFGAAPPNACARRW